jgi:pSer/pThr/pTyr-binding forkhead associated (FHA) protein
MSNVECLICGLDAAMSLEWILLGLRVLATVILYSFLGLAFYLIWRDLKRIEIQSQVNYQLRVIAANGNEPWAVGETLPLQPVTILGRGAKNTIVLHEPTASTRHARLSRTNGTWWLEDLGSQSGTTLNELPLSKPIPLTEGDIIGIGSVRFRLEVAGSTPFGAPEGVK